MKMEYCGWIWENEIFRKWWKYLLLAAMEGILLIEIKECLLSGREQTILCVEDAAQGQNFTRSAVGKTMSNRLNDTIPDASLNGFAATNLVPDMSIENSVISAEQRGSTTETDISVSNPDIWKETEIAEGTEISEGTEAPGFLPNLTEPEKNSDEKEYPDEEEYPDGKEQPGGETYPEGEEHTWLPSGFEINAEGMIVDYRPVSDEAAGVLELPDTCCTGIVKGAFARAGAGIYELYIPSNITQIEAGGLSGLSDLEWICAEPENAYFQSREGILYDREMTSVLAFPAGRIGVYAVPQGIVRFASCAFEGTRLQKIDMRACCGAIKTENCAFGENGADGLVILAPAGCQEIYRESFAETGAIVR